MRTAKRPQAVWFRTGLFGATLGSVLLSAGCQTATGTGAAVGGLVGAGAGALLGGRHAGQAAVAGGLIGAGTGAAVGSVVDANREQKAQAAAAAQRGPLGPEQIAEMAHSNVGDAVIINQIRQANVRYNLSADWIVWLKQNNVSDAVITEMQASGYRRVYAPAPVVVYDAPPPPVRVGVGFSVGR